jgi:hypothetical protein
VILNGHHVVSIAVRYEFPGAFPAVALLKTSDGKNRLLAISPAHSRALHSLGRESFARCFDYAAADGKASSLILCVTHTIFLVFKVQKLCVENLSFLFVLFAFEFSLHRGQLFDDLFCSIVLFLENDFQLFIFRASGNALFFPAKATTAARRCSQACPKSVIFTASL